MKTNRQRIYLDSFESERVHRAKRMRKLERIQMYKALLEEWEARDDADHDYILELRKKLRAVQCQYDAMKI